LLNSLSSSVFKSIAVVLAIVGAVACKSAEQVASESPESQQATNTDELEEIYWEQVRASRMDFSQADVNFMIGMIGHHAQALIMSRLAPENGASEQVQTLAARIINAQNDEIAFMQQWLRDRGQPVPQVHIEGLKLMLHGVGGHHSDHKNMPGMLSQEQLEELAKARGTEFDRLYLTYMIEHHSGAVTMVKKLFGTAGAAQEEQAFRLASSIQVDQITEIERMKKMLEALPAADQSR
jgi:uncharacterized protein (DUF305 family)